MSAASLSALPDANGRFGPFGGRYVPETLVAALDQLAAEYDRARADIEFQREFVHYLKVCVGRPSPLYLAERLTREAGGARIYLKREDLNHTGAHKINNCIGQVLLAKRMGKTRIIAETGAGQHGVATATACALFGLPCQVYMGEEDVRRQKLNVFKMRAMGTEVVPVTTGSRTLRDAINEAMRDWMASVGDTHYILGSVVGPHPFPRIVRDFQSVIGSEARAQSLEQIGKLPEVVVACVGGGSNAAGMFHPFVGDAGVELVGVEAGGRGLEQGDHSATLNFGHPGVLHGTFSYVLQDDDGQTADVHSVSAGLDYPGVGPEHSFWKDAGRVRYTSVGDDDAMKAFRLCSRAEGILPALETAHAVVEAMRIASTRRPDEAVVVCFSGRGDKDCYEVARLEGEALSNPIDRVFIECRAAGKSALMPFLPAGDPDIAATVAFAEAAIRGGASLLEIGFPYSDPIADGPVIQASYTRALGKGLKLDDVFAAAATIAKRHPSTALVAMASFSLVRRRGPEAFAAKAKASGFSGLIAPDLPAEESDGLAEVCAAAGLALIQLVAPTTAPARVEAILRRASAFVYVVSVAGITGERKDLPPELLAHLSSLRKRTSLPLCVGFGVSKPEHVRGLRGHADGVIVGSAFVRRIEEGGPPDRIAARVEMLARELAAEA